MEEYIKFIDPIVAQVMFDYNMGQERLKKRVRAQQEGQERRCAFVRDSAEPVAAAFALLLSGSSRGRVQPPAPLPHRLPRCSGQRFRPMSERWPSR